MGIWLAARRLHQGKFIWPGSRHGLQVALSDEQLLALVLGLPWQRVGPGGAIFILYRLPQPVGPCNCPMDLSLVLACSGKVCGMTSLPNLDQLTPEQLRALAAQSAKR